MIEVNGLVKRFDGFAALDGAALSVPAGSVYGLVGPNGAGKSTLIRHLTGIFRQDAGTVRIGGEDVCEAPRCWFLPTTCGSWRTSATTWASWTTAACCWSGPWPSCRTTW